MRTGLAVTSSRCSREVFKSAAEGLPDGCNTSTVTLGDVYQCPEPPKPLMHVSVPFQSVAYARAAFSCTCNLHQKGAQHLQR